MVCTSATLATSGGFHFARSRLGAPPGTDEMLLESPFDFAARAAPRHLPDDLPEPNDPRFSRSRRRPHRRAREDDRWGRFVLCTSTRAMRTLHALLRSRTKLPLMMQGERPKHILLSRPRRASGKAVLVLTMSFWEGVDVPVLGRCVW